MYCDVHKVLIVVDLPSSPYDAQSYWAEYNGLNTNTELKSDPVELKKERKIHAMASEIFFCAARYVKLVLMWVRSLDYICMLLGIIMPGDAIVD